MHEISSSDLNFFIILTITVSISNSILIVILIFFMRMNFSNNIRKSNFDNQNQKSIEEITWAEKNQVKEISISELTEVRLAKELSKSQDSNVFLEKKISINDLARLWGTNQKYVSYILNKYTGLDFNNYVQHFRINYLVNCIESNPDLINEKFSILAEKVGFSSVSKFSTVFKAVKGIPPSEYFKKIPCKF